MITLRIAIALCILGVPVLARTASIKEPIVFDFEDGLQGWELLGATQRVQTQLLGGEWAILGDGFLEGGAAMSLGLGDIPFGSFLVIFDVVVIDGTGQVDASTFFGQAGTTASLRWLAQGGFTPHVGPVVAFVDNVTLISLGRPVPEPAALTLLALSLVSATVSRLRIR